MWRIALNALRALICAAAAVPCALWLLNAEHFQSWDLESVVAQTLLHTAPWTAIALLLLLIVARLSDGSCRREIAALRAAQDSPPAKPVATENRRGAAAALRLILAACAVALIALGILNGGMNDVFVKAISICTECIGLG